MKKGLVFILAILYITLTSGIVVNAHYCMGRLTDVTYGHEKDGRCDRCGMEQKAGCCETEHTLVKADTDHITPGSLTAPVFHLDLLQNVIPLAQLSAIPVNDEAGCTKYHSPPDKRTNHLDVFNSVFRI